MSTADESIKQAVKSGAIVVGLGRAAGPAADALREALGAHARECADDDWEASRVNHLCLVVECGPTGACCEAAEKFMREVRRSDGYSVYSEIIRRRVAVLALGRCCLSHDTRLCSSLTRRRDSRTAVGLAQSLARARQRDSRVFSCLSHDRDAPCCPPSGGGGAAQARRVHSPSAAAQHRHGRVCVRRRGPAMDTEGRGGAGGAGAAAA